MKFAGSLYLPETMVFSATYKPTNRGTVRRLLEEDLMPQHLCGTSVRAGVRSAECGVLKSPCFKAQKMVFSPEKVMFCALKW